jgi:transcriptional regulator GlxA family with amidase domain
VISPIHTLRDRFAEPVRIDDLASIAQLSPSAFHRQFKAITSMTPLQYQKQLRLMDARRLMVSDAANVENAASSGLGQRFAIRPRIFSYVRESPRRDVASLRGIAV